MVWRYGGARLAQDTQCKAGESIARCVNVTESGIEPSLPRQKAERLPLGHLAV